MGSPAGGGKSGGSSSVGIRKQTRIKFPKAPF